MLWCSGSGGDRARGRSQVRNPAAALAADFARKMPRLATSTEAQIKAILPKILRSLPNGKNYTQLKKSKKHSTQ